MRGVAFVGGGCGGAAGGGGRGGGRGALGGVEFLVGCFCKGRMLSVGQGDGAIGGCRGNGGGGGGMRTVDGAFVGSTVAEALARSAVQVRRGDFFHLRNGHAPVVDLVRGAGHAGVVVGDQSPGLRDGGGVVGGVAGRG